METPYIELPLKEFLVALNWFLSLNVIWIFKGTPFAIPCHIVHFAKLRTWPIPSPLTMSNYAKNLNNLICRIYYLLQMMKMFCRQTQYLQLLPAITIIKSSAKKKKLYGPLFFTDGVHQILCSVNCLYYNFYTHFHKVRVMHWVIRDIKKWCAFPH